MKNFMYEKMTFTLAEVLQNFWKTLQSFKIILGSWHTFSDNEFEVVVVVDLVKFARAELATMTGAGATLSFAAFAAASWFFFFS